MDISKCKGKYLVLLLIVCKLDASVWLVFLMMKKYWILKSLKIALAFGFILWGVNGFGKNYYVKTDGSDDRSGTSPISAWETIDRVNRTSFLPRDSILFRRGDVFVGGIVVKSSGLDKMPIVYGAYGSGEKPNISGFEELKEWENEGNGIYSCPTKIKENVNLLTN